MRTFALALAVLAGAEVTATAPVLGNPVEGRALALKVCSPCHVVASKQEWLPLLRVPTPSFKAIAQKKTSTATSIEQFVLTTHADPGQFNKMPSPMLTREQAADIADYILSLKDESGKPH